MARRDGPRPAPSAAPAVSALDRLEAPARTAQARAGGLSVASGLLWPVQAALIAWVISGWLHGAPAGRVIWAAIGFAAAGTLRALLDHRAGGVLFAAADAVLAAERKALIARESLRAPGGGGASSAELGAMAAQKLPMLVPYLTRYRPARFRAAVLPVLFVAVTAYVSWAAGVILLVAGPLIPVFMALIGMAAREASERQMAEISDMNSLLMDRLAALVDIRLLDATERTAADFATRAEALRARTMGVLRIAFLSSTVLELFSALGMALVAIYVGFTLLGQIDFGSWGDRLTVGEGVFLLMLAPEFFQPLRDVAAAWHDRAAAQAVADELQAMADSASGRVLGQGAPAVPLPGPAAIEMTDITIQRGPRTVGLPDLSVAPGESVAITGPSGAGKSTMLALIAGLATPTTGRIVVAGQPLDDATADAWRARLSWVGQAPHFLDAPLAANLDLRGTGADPAPALAAAGAAGIVAALPGGLAARLGETGGGISGGEARRLLLARGLLAGPDVLLADEPTADLDAETAAGVIATLAALRDRGLTLIVATHDPRLAQAMGRSVALDAPAATPESPA